MNRTFINRIEELNFLDGKFKSNKFEFLLLYGRRRIGKTEVIKKFISEKDAVYFLCDKKGTEDNLERFKKALSAFFNEPKIASQDLEEIFNYVVKKDKKIVLVFDEFSYLVEADKSIPSVFQRSIDQVLISSKVMLIICGSSISMMESLLGYKNPLYGRKTGHWKVLPLSLKELKKFYPKYSLSQLIEAWSILGGIPFYLENFDDSLSIQKNVEKTIFNKSGRLYEEIDFILKEELREPNVYKSILESISKGKNRTIEISDFSKIRVNDLDRYLKVLIQLGIIKREFPITENKSKRSQYVFIDNFFNFWFRFCESNKSYLEISKLDTVSMEFEKNFNSYVGRKFETICQSLLHYSNIGRWWGNYREGAIKKILEIDIIGLNEETKEILFGECKWSEKVDAKLILAKLKEKAKYVEWNNKDRKERYAIFAKSFKEKIKEDHLLLFDFEDLEKTLMRK